MTLSRVIKKNRTTKKMSNSAGAIKPREWNFFYKNILMTVGWLRFLQIIKILDPQQKQK